MSHETPGPSPEHAWMHEAIPRILKREPKLINALHEVAKTGWAEFSLNPEEIDKLAGDQQPAYVRHELRTLQERLAPRVNMSIQDSPAVRGFLRVTLEIADVKRKVL